MALPKQYSPADFLNLLHEDCDESLPLAIVGMIRESQDGDSESFEFSATMRCGDWEEVPIAIVEEIEILGTSSCGDHQHERAVVYFRASDEEEVNIYKSLIRMVTSDERRT